MSSNEKNDAEPVSLRRSTRSTRGSLKPVVDLSKVSADVDSDSEDIKNSEDVVEISDSDSNDEEFEDVKVSRSKSKPTSRGKVPASAQKVSCSTRKRQPTDDANEDKISKRGPRKSEVSRSKSKANTKTPVKKELTTEFVTTKSAKTETIDEDDGEIYYDLNEKDLKEINMAFDSNRSDDAEELLGCDDLKTAMRSLGFEPRVGDLKKLISKYGNKDGKVTRDGFHKIMASKMNSAPGYNDTVANDEISRVFNLLDLDKTGRITLENLRAISKELNEELDDEELLEMIMEADLDGDQQIDKNEFYHIMKKTSLY